jgi:RNA polymerase sigma factor (TIGR02999 family)
VEGEKDITALLRAWSAGDERAGEALMPLIYDDLRRRAAQLFKSESAGHTLQPTALVHETYSKLVNAGIEWRDRAHFYALATRMMRRLLINHANAGQAAKRGGGALAVTLLDSHRPAQSQTALISELMEALSALERHDERKAKLIELKYFGGLTTEEIAEVTGLSAATIGRDLRFARAWLKANLGESG